jgi:Tol biopolymer transport system component
MNGKLDRRTFLTGAFFSMGAGALFLSGCAINHNERKRLREKADEMKYEVKRSYLLVENGGQTDWAMHDPDLITYCRLEADGYWDVWTIRSSGLENRPLTVNKPNLSQKNNANPGWHPSGKYIVFQGEKDRKFGNPFLSHPGMGGFCDVWLGKSDGSRFWPLTNLDCPLTIEEAKSKPVTGVLMPKFSHNGKKIHWSQWRAPGPKGEKWWWEIKVADFVDDPDHPQVENIKTYNPGLGHLKECFMFTPDDKQLLLAGTLEEGLPEYAMDIYLLDLESGKYANLTQTPTIWEEGCKMSPDGKKIFYGSNEGYEKRIDPQNPLGTVGPITGSWMLTGPIEKELPGLTSQAIPIIFGDRLRLL